MAAITVTWGTKIINVPIDALEFVSTDRYKLSIDTFRLALKALEESEDGMAFPDTHQHNTEVAVAGITLARVVEIINGYTITFEDGQYLVTLYGANSNIPDVVNFNQVSVRAVTSAGLHVVEGGALTTEEHAWLQQVYDKEGGKWQLVGNQMICYKEDNITEIMRFNLYDESGASSMENVYRRERV